MYVLVYHYNSNYYIIAHAACIVHALSFEYHCTDPGSGNIIFYFNKKQPYRNVLISALRTAFVPGWLRQLRQRFFSNSLISKDLKDTHINSQFADKVNIAARLRELRSHGCNGLCRTLKEHHITNVIHPFLAVGLER